MAPAQVEACLMDWLSTIINSSMFVLSGMNGLTISIKKIGGGSKPGFAH